MTRPDGPFDPTLPGSTPGAGSSPAQDPTLPQSGPAGGAAERFAPGRVVAGRYKIVRFLAEGGMGEVYEAEDQGLHGERVALKAVRGGAGGDAHLVARFKREIALARKVTHPNVCRIFDLGTERDAGAGAPEILFLTMELLRGETLADRLRRAGPLPIDQAGALLAQVAAALDAAHAAGVVHRDLKTSNVFLAARAGGGGRGARAVVTDFGLARQVDEPGAGAERVTGAVQLVGTPAYMAPEQVEGHAISARTDVYSLGVVLYEALTGQLPFAGSTPLSTAIKRVKEPPPSPRSVREDLPEAWERVVLRCLAVDPADRFERASDAVRALAEAGAIAPETVLEVVATDAAGSASGSGAGAASASASKSASASASTSPAAPARSPRRTLVLRLATVALLAVAALAAWRAFRPAARSAAPAPLATARPLAPLASGARWSVAVLGFRNLAADPKLDWLSLALAETFSTELGATEQLRLVPGETVARTRADLALAPADSYAPDTLARLRAALGADFVVVGSYLPLDANRVRVDVRLQDTAAGDTVAAIAETGTIDDLPALVARAATRLDARLGVAAPDQAAAAAVRAAEPGGADAARAYAEGLAHLRLDECVPAHERLVAATQADPRHALAWMALSQANACLGDDAGSLDAAKRAWDLSQGLRREDRLRVEARYRTAAHDLDRVIAIDRALWEFFPDNPDYGVALAVAQSNAGHLKESEDTLDAIRKSGGGDLPEVDLVGAAVAYDLSDYARGLPIARRAAENARRIGSRVLYGRARQQEAWLLRFLGRTDEALAAALEARQSFADTGNRSLEVDALNTIGGVYLDQGEVAHALETRLAALALARQAGTRRQVARLASNASELQRSTGHPLEARKLADEALALSKDLADPSIEMWSLVFVGNALVDAGQPEAARAYYQRGAELAAKVGRKQCQATALLGLAGVDAEAGRDADARRALAAARALFTDMKTPATDADSRAALVELRAGHYPAALRAADAAVAETDRQVQLVTAETGAFAAFALLEQGDPAAAARRAEAALAAGQKTGAIGEWLEAQIALAAAHGMTRHDATSRAGRAELDAAWKLALDQGYLGLALEARLWLGRAELANGDPAAGRAHLLAVAKDAPAAGYLVLGQRAAALAHSR